MLRREQYRRADRPDRAAAVARAVTLGKVANCRTVLLRARLISEISEARDNLRFYFLGDKRMREREATTSFRGGSRDLKVGPQALNMR